MTSLLFYCQCGARLQVAEDLAGRRVRCPACRRITAAPRAEIPEIEPLEDPPEIEEIQPLPAASPARSWPVCFFFVAILFAAGLHLLALVGLSMIPRAGDPGEQAATTCDVGRLAAEQCQRNLEHRRPALLEYRMKHGRFPSVPFDVGGAGPGREGCPSEILTIRERPVGTGADRRRVWTLSCPAHRTSAVLDDFFLASHR